MRTLLAGMSGGLSVAVILAGLGLGLVNKHEHEFPAVKQLMGPAVLLRIEGHQSSSGWCSGAFISPTLILTAKHCIHPDASITAQTEDGTNYPMVEAYLPENTLDIAIIKVDHPFKGWTPQVYCHMPKRGDVLQNVGNPNVLRYIYSTVVVSGYGNEVYEKGPHDTELDGTFLFAGMSIGGQSGSPMYDIYGRIVGVLTIGWDPGTGGATSIEAACDFVTAQLKVPA